MFRLLRNAEKEREREREEEASLWLVKHRFGGIFANLERLSNEQQ